MPKIYGGGGGASYPSGEYWSIYWPGGSPNRPTSLFAAQDEVAVNFQTCDAFDDGTGESVWLEGRIPVNAGSGTLKMDIDWCSANTSSSKTFAVDIDSKFWTPNNTEALNDTITYSSVDAASDTDSTGDYDLMSFTVTLTNSSSGMTAGDFFRFRVTRDVAADDLGGSDALVVGYRLYEEV